MEKVKIFEKAPSKAPALVSLLDFCHSVLDMGESMPSCHAENTGSVPLFFLKGTVPFKSLPVKAAPVWWQELPPATGIFAVRRKLLTAQKIPYSLPPHVVSGGSKRKSSSFLFSFKKFLKLLKQTL
jgi:hypothetical protein